MAAASREERRLMRQRGAGTRQIQEVDFGFSFGLPVAPPVQQQPPHKSPPAEQSNVASRGSLFGPDPTPENQKQPSPSPPPPQSTPQNSQTKLRTPTTGRSSVRKSPSSRNGHSGSSIYDIPPDSPRNISSGVKRRRIGPGSQDGPMSTTPGSGPRQTNGIGSHEGQNTEHTEQTQSLGSQEAAASHVAPEPPGRPTTSSPYSNEPSSNFPSAHKDDPGINQPDQTPTNNIQKEPNAPDSQESIAEAPSKPQASKPRKKPRKRKSIIWSRKPRRSSDEANKQRNEETQAEQTHEPELEPELPEQPTYNPTRKKKKSKPIGRKPDDEKTVSAEPGDGEGSNMAQESTEASEMAAKIYEQKGPKRKKRQSVLQKKPRSKASGPAFGEQQPDDENQGDEKTKPPEQENAHESSPEEPEPEPLSRSRKKRKSTALGPRRTRRSLETVEEEPEAQPENEEREAAPQQEAPRKKQQKPRQANSESGSKKGSFPVTVHRLTNVGALDAISESDGSHEPDSSDELATRTKFPNRGGVNPADVLSQICCETLEKTLSALENGIENESQPARRAEFSRKRKAVEAFSSELEGRLFDMSEVLDSNFALAMGLRRAKKEMLESRSKLMDIRRQREEIALRTDEVRRKHLEEERTQTQHNAVNNSLHNLELAIDRDQRHSEPDKNNPAAGIEFLLRSVADDVSSTAPGSQGGLLNQVKNFNVRLEEYVKGSSGGG